MDDGRPGGKMSKRKEKKPADIYGIRGTIKVEHLGKEKRQIDTSARGFAWIQAGWRCSKLIMLAPSNPGQVVYPAWVFIWRRVEPISRLGTIVIAAVGGGRMTRHG